MKDVYYEMKLNVPSCRVLATRLFQMGLAQKDHSEACARVMLTEFVQ
jgi:hypothetical protein